MSLPRSTRLEQCHVKIFDNIVEAQVCLEENDAIITVESASFGPNGEVAVIYRNIEEV